MAKQCKTAHELKDIVAARLGVGDVLIAVNKDRIDGWRATVLTTLPGFDDVDLAILDWIVAEQNRDITLPIIIA
jgi:hypothetical protein